MLDLNSLLSTSQQTLYTITVGVAVNNNGQIAANGVNNSTAQNIAILLTPIPLAAPVVVAIINGTIGENGWYVTPTSVRWQVTGNPTPTTSGCGAVSVPNTRGQTITCTATNSVSVATDSVVVKEDTVAPSISIKVPVKGATYQLHQHVVSSYACLDATSHIAACTGTVPDNSAVATSRAGTHTFSVTGFDNAGNKTSASVLYQVK